MRGPRPAEDHSAWPVHHLVLDAAGADGVLGIPALDQDTAVPPRVVVQSAVVVAAVELMQVDVEQPIAREDPPPEHVGVGCSADDEIRRSAHHTRG